MLCYILKRGQLLRSLLTAVIFSSGALCVFSEPAHAGTVTEFYNTSLDNYFITADSSEAAALGSGSAGPGWIRTGYTFNSGGSTSVCRFYGSVSPGPNSHFYTVDASECADLKQLQASTPPSQKRWNFESLDFVSTPPSNSTCPAETVPVYRAYNNGSSRGVDSNHRITSSPTAIQEVANRGWINEGVVMCAPSVSIASLFVAPNGSDSNPGTITQPFLTIQKCATTAVSGSTCQIRAGTYHETVTPNSGIVITSYNNELVTIDGTDPVTGWTLYQGSIYKASTGMSSGDTNQVFVGQQMMTEARWPNGDDLFHINWATAKAGTTATQLVDSNLPNTNWTGAKIHLWSGTDPWDPQTGTITASQSGVLAFTVDGASFQTYIIPMPGGYYYLFGTLTALDAQREWFYDKSAGALYFWAPAGVDPNTLDVRAKQRQYAFDLSGKSNVTIQNINLFASTINSDASSTNNTLNGIVATYPSHFTGLPDLPACNSPGCQTYPSSYWFNHLADSGIIVNGSNNTVTNSAISYSAGNGITVLGTNNTVKNNLIHHIDYIGNYGSGISLQGTGHKIQNNTIYATARFSIFISTISYYPYVAPNNNDISYNNLYNASMITRDAGAIYAGGQPGVTGTRIHHNWIHDIQSLYSGVADNFGYSGVYLDEDTSGWQVDQNVLWNNQYSSIMLHGSSSGVTAPNNNNISNNSIIDVSPSSNITLNDISNCGSTQIVNNMVLVPVVQNHYQLPTNTPNCTATNNSSTAPGATEMTSAVQVGCNLAGCSSSGPPIISGGSVAASIATQPYSVAVSAGQSATFNVTGAGSMPISYQWQRNGVNIGGATSASYTTPATSSADNGAEFSVQVGNSVGNIKSIPAILTVR